MYINKFGIFHSSIPPPFSMTSAPVVAPPCFLEAVESDLLTPGTSGGVHVPSFRRRRRQGLEAEAELLPRLAQTTMIAPVLPR